MNKLVTRRKNTKSGFAESWVTSIYESPQAFFLLGMVGARQVDYYSFKMAATIWRERAR